MNKPQSLSLGFKLGLLFIFALSLYIQFHLYLNWDSTWLLEASSRLLAGGDYHTRFVDPNTPLIIYLGIIPVLMTKLTGLSIEWSMRLFTYLIALASMALCSELLKILLPKDSNSRSLFLIGLALGFLVLTNTDFGQREHLMVMLILPYAVLRSSEELNGIRLKILVGLLAGIGFALKPQFLIPFVIMELCRLRRVKKIKLLFTPDLITIIAIFFIYLAATIHFNPEYFSFTFPLTTIFYSRFPHASTEALLYNSDAQVILITLVLSRVTTFPESKVLTTLQKNLIDLNLIFLGLYLLQGLAWQYHLLPSLVCSLLLLILNFQAFMQKNKFSFLLSFVIVGIAMLLKITVVSTLNGIYNKTQPKSPINQIIAAVNELHPHYYMVWTTTVNPTPILMNYTTAKLASRFSGMWLVPAIHQQSLEPSNPKNESQLKWRKKLLYKIVIDDILQFKPEVILVDVSDEKAYLKGRFDYIEFFNEDPQFRKIWGSYKFKKRVLNFDLYQRSQGT